MHSQRLLTPLIALFFWVTVICEVHAAGTGSVREYWIAADEVMWDYAPSFPLNKISGKTFTPEQKVFVDDFIGRKYLKALYREYTSGFRELKQRQSDELHLGTLGPIIRAEVGDTIVVHFRNNTRFPASMHPHGVLYHKDSEGAPYADNTGGADKADDAVPQGGNHTYIWEVPERAGPGPSDPSSIVWEYHSHTDEPADTNAGLIGPIIITRNGMALPNGKPRDVDREFVTLFTIYDENSSGLFQANASGYEYAFGTEAFEESNLMHSMNGYVYGNNQGYDIEKGQKVRWYIIGMGTEVDIHTPHWHGVTLLHNSERIDVTEIMPATTKTFDMVADNSGTWLFHCHVNDHIIAGMQTTFTIH